MYYLPRAASSQDLAVLDEIDRLERFIGGIARAKTNKRMESESAPIRSRLD